MIHGVSFLFGSWFPILARPLRFLGRRIGKVVGPQVVDFPISELWVSQGKIGRQGIFCNFCEPVVGHKNAGGVCLLSFKFL